jgi:hypothetical protein
MAVSGLVVTNHKGWNRAYFYFFSGSLANPDVNSVKKKLGLSVESCIVREKKAKQRTAEYGERRTNSRRNHANNGSQGILLVVEIAIKNVTLNLCRYNNMVEENVEG